MTKKKTKKALSQRGRKTKEIAKLVKVSRIGEIIHKPKIRVIGIGGGGNSIISEIALALKSLPHLDFIVANTDRKALKLTYRKVKKFLFGQEVTRGLGCGMNPQLGKIAAEKAKEKIAELLRGSDFVIFVASLGGGAGSGATPVFSRIAKDLKIMNMGLFTLPFKFEGRKKIRVAKASLRKIIPNLNAFSIIANENVFRVIDKKTPLHEALSIINKTLAENLRGLVEIIYSPGLINIDFADLKTILEHKPPIYQGRLAYLHSAQAQGPNKVEEVIKKVLSNPLSEYNPGMKSFSVQNILFNITSSKDLKMKEVEQICKAIFDLNKKAKIIFGISQDPKYEDKIKITLLTTGSLESRLQRAPKKKTKKRIFLKKLKIKKLKTKKTELKSKKPKITKSQSSFSIKKKLVKISIGKKPIKKRVKTHLKFKKKVAQKQQKSPLKKKFKKKLSLPKKFTKSPKKSIKTHFKTCPPEPSTQADGRRESSSSSSSKRQQTKLTQNVSTTANLGENEKIRKSALDLKKEAEKTERKILEAEEKWNIPAFLRRKA